LPAILTDYFGCSGFDTLQKEVFRVLVLNALDTHLHGSPFEAIFGPDVHNDAAFKKTEVAATISESS
jgi:hypothetical protein